MKRHFVRLFGCCAAVLLCCTGFNGPVRRFSADGKRLIVLEDAAEFCRWEIFPESAAAVSLELVSPKHGLLLTAGSRKVLADGVLFYLREPVRCFPDGTWVAGETDWKEFLTPLLEDSGIPPSPVRKVVIDAGHGGGDSGAAHEDLQEKSVNLDLALRVAERLRKQGLTVELTRGDDRFVSLDGRADRVRIANADLFLSIHQNAAEQENAEGTEIYFSRDNRYCDASIRLAQNIQSGIAWVLGESEEEFRDRGVRQGNFWVLRKADCPAALLECGFISNPAERKRMTRSDYLEHLADGIAAGIAGYVKRDIRERLR